MKILHVINTLETGGAEKLLVDLLPRLKQLGHDVDLAVFKCRRTPFYDQLEAAGINIIGFSHKENVYSPLHIFRLCKLIRHYDIVHTHNFAEQMFAAIAKFSSKPILFTTEHSTSNRRRKWNWFKPIDYAIYNKYNKIICISDQAEKNLRLFHPRLKNVCIIYNGVDVAKYHSALPLPTMKRDGKFVVIMVASMRSAKDQDTLIRAFSHLDNKNYQLWLVGDGDRRPLIEQCINENDLSDRVLLLGVLSDIPAILKAADIVVQSSHWEGFGLAAVEGMAAGKPVIASNVAGLAQVVEGAGILFHHGDDKALATEIEHLASDPDHYRAVADRCYQRALQFDISKMVDQYNQLYHSVAQKD